LLLLLLLLLQGVAGGLCLGCHRGLVVCGCIGGLLFCWELLLRLRTLLLLLRVWSGSAPCALLCKGGTQLQLQPAHQQHATNTRRLKRACLCDTSEDTT
jgi:hypothetical protein